MSLVNKSQPSSADAKKKFNLVNIIYMRVRNSLMVDHTSDLMMLNLLGKELVY